MTTPSVIEPAITRLVREAPVIEPEVVVELERALIADGRPLAVAIARVVVQVGHGIDPAIALPALAMACATLLDPRLTEREHEAARFEIETLLPVPARGPRIAAPDVPVTALRRR